MLCLAISEGSSVIGKLYFKVATLNQALHSHFVMEDTRKNHISIYPRTMNMLTCKESKFSNLLYY